MSTVPDVTPVVVMGVTGSGKSTVGAALAQRLRLPFLDADTLHPPANIARMTAGEPLNDDDRHPWLEKVGEWLASHRDGGVVACSALKRAYRDRLRSHWPAVEFVHLHGSPELIRGRLAARTGHFLPAALPTRRSESLLQKKLMVRSGPQCSSFVSRGISSWSPSRFATHCLRSGHVSHAGFVGVQTSAPSSMSAWLKSPTRFSGSTASAAAHTHTLPSPSRGSPR